MSIIAINGKIGSGKDTVGSFIQQINTDRNWQIKKFAGKLKEVASILSGVSVDRFEDQEFKKQDMNSCWGMTYRDFLQKIGTEAMRNGLHENVWVNALFSEYIVLDDTKRASMGNVIDYSDCSFPDWIITDLRFANEFDSVKQRRGITVRVTRPGLTFNNHISETALDNFQFDYEIVNDGTLEDLYEKVKKLCEKIC